MSASLAFRPPSILAGALLVVVTVASPGQTATRPLTAPGIQAWKAIRSQSVSNDGKWLAYVVAGNPPFHGGLSATSPVPP